MGISAEKKLHAERVIAAFRQILQTAHRNDAAWTRRYRAGDEGAMEELVTRACAETNMSVGEFHEALESDGQLLELQKRCVAEVLLGQIKPPPET
jgi:hypothetical protein